MAKRPYNRQNPNQVSLWHNRYSLTDRCQTMGQAADGGSEPKENLAMRKWLLFFALGAVALSNAGCLLNQFPSDPAERMEILVYESEDLRQIKNEVRRFWMND